MEGGNAAAVIAQELLKEKGSVKHQPKLQVLIYPWVQLVNQIGLPSLSFYHGKLLISGSKLTLTKCASWYLGIHNVTEEIEASFLSNAHFMLLDEVERKRYMSYLDVNKIGNEYKIGKSYYEVNEMQNKYMYPSKLDPNSLLARDPKMAALFRKLFSPRMSPLLADPHHLKGLPRAYVLVLEWDNLKGKNFNFFNF